MQGAGLRMREAGLRMRGAGPWTQGRGCGRRRRGYACALQEEPEVLRKDRWSAPPSLARRGRPGVCTK